LVDSPACLVADSHDLGGNLQRILQAMGQDAPVAKPILEINPAHAIVRRIMAAVKDAGDGDVVGDGDVAGDAGDGDRARSTKRGRDEVKGDGDAGDGDVAGDAQLDDWAHVLFDQAALAEGAPPADPGGYVMRVNRLLAGGD